MKILTPSNYYDTDEYMSVSSYKQYLKCEVLGLRGFTGEMSQAMLVGSYVDAFVEGTLDEFIKEHPEIISSRGASKGQLKSEFKQAELICEYITNDKVFSQFMSGEKQTIMTGKIEGVPFKIKMDSYSPNIAINDLKVMRSVTDKSGKFYDFVTPWGYDIQMACYQEIEYQNTGQRLPCFICAVTKEEPINSVIVHIPQSILDIALYNVKTNINQFYNIKTGKTEPLGCGVCKVCIENRNETPIIGLEELLDDF